MKEINNEILQNYRTHRLDIEQLPELTVKNQLYVLNKFNAKINKPFDKITEEDIRKFLKGYKPSTRDKIIAILRKFFAWHYNVETNDKLPDCIRKFKTRNQRQKQQENNEITFRERVITPNEYQRLIKVASHPMHKALIETLYLFGLRISELLSMNATDVIDNGNLVKIIVRKSKTQPREIPHREPHPEFLMEWFDTYQPNKKQKEKPLWTSLCHRTHGERLTRRGAWTIAKTLSKKARLSREITLHDFRHTAISRDRANGMPDTLIESKYGLVKGSLMLKCYDHTGNQELEKYLLETSSKQRPQTRKGIERQNKTIVTDLSQKIIKQEKQLQEQQKEIKHLDTMLKMLMKGVDNYFEK